MSAQGSLWRVGRSVDIPPLEGRSVEIDDRRIAVFNTAMGFFATEAACPHQGGPLSDGLVAGACVTCPLHNWRIDLTSGEVVSGGEGQIETYDVREVNGWLFVEIGKAAELVA